MEKSKCIKRYLKFTAVALIVLLFSGCKDYFEDPLKDNETGDNINLLILDFNFFNSRMTFKLYDAKDSTLISLPAELRFSGSNGNDIVTFSGKKNNIHTTTQGQIELTIDPNVTITPSNLFEFAIDVKVQGYKDFQKGFQFVNEGKRTFELYLVNKTNEDSTNLGGNIDTGGGDSSIVFILPPQLNLKSAAVAEESCTVNYKIPLSDFQYLLDLNGNVIFNSYNDVLEAYNSDPENFALLTFSKYSGYAPGTDVIFYEGNKHTVLFRKLETGTLTNFVVNGKTVGNLNGISIKSYCTYEGSSVTPDLFGFVDFDSENGAWYFKEPDADTIYYQNLNIAYTVAKASLEPLCANGSSITFSSSVISSFSIDADVFDQNGTLINTIQFKGNFPETFTIENAPSKAVKLVFRNNNTSFQPLPDLEIPNFCSGSYNIAVQPTAGYNQYQIVLKAICPDNPTIAVAPTYSAEIKIKNSADLWQGVDMIGGKVDLLGKPNQEYELRLLWEDEWEYSTYSTFFNGDNGSYTGETYPKTKIESAYIENGARIRINVEKEFNQNVCDDLGW
jgi:hypothetical protein